MKSETILTALDTLQEAMQQTKSPSELTALSDRMIALIDRLGDKGEPLWTIEQTAEYLHVSRACLQRWCRIESIPFLPCGAQKVFIPSVIRKWCMDNMKRVHNCWRKRR